MRYALLALLVLPGCGPKPPRLKVLDVSRPDLLAKPIAKLQPVKFMPHYELFEPRKEGLTGYEGLWRYDAPGDGKLAGVAVDGESMLVARRLTKSVATAASPAGRPTSWTPTGSPSSSVANGIETAGWPVMFHVPV